VSGDYPAALWLPAHHSNFRQGRAVQAPTRLVIHCTDGHGEIRNTAAMIARPLAKPTSFHFGVGQDGLIVQCVRVQDTAWHAHEANSYSIGIEHSARTPGELGANDPGLPPSDKLYDASAALAAWLCKAFNIPASRVGILGHAEADKTTTHTKCPLGCGWDWAGYITRVANALRAIG